MKNRFTIIDGYKLKDRWDGIEITFSYDGGDECKTNLSDAEAERLITDMESILASEDRPLELVSWSENEE